MITMLLNIGVVVCLTVVSVHDIRNRQILPLSYPIILILSLWGISINSLLGGGLLFALTLVIGMLKGMGGGDVKLIAVCGIYLGFPLCIPFFMITIFFYFFLFSCYVIANRFLKKQYDTSCAFAPYITAGMIITLILK